MRNVKQLMALSCAGLLVAGCMSTPKSDIDPDWRSSERARELSPVHVLHDGDRVVFSTGRNVYLISGADGRVVNSLEESWMQAAARGVTFGGRGFGGTVGQFMASNYDVMPFPQHNMVMLFDYQANREVVIAMDSENGEVLWSSSDYEYSLNKYEALISAGADIIGRGLANMLGGQHQGEDRETRRERQVNFLDTVAMAIPNSDYIAFKTFDGLYILDPRTGEQIGHVADFRGAGLADVIRVDNDLIIVSGAGSIAGTLGGATAYDIARVSMNGDIRWKSEHSGTRTAGLIRVGNVVLVDGAPTEAFDLRTGEKLWENDVRRYWENYHHHVVDGEHVYFASDLLGRVGRIEESRIWKVHARTGNVVWETPIERGYHHSLELHGNNLVVSGSGRMYTEGRDGVMVFDARTGEKKWSTPEFERGGVFSTARSFAPPVVMGDTVFAVDLSRVYAFDINTGDLKYRDNHSNRGTNGVVGLDLFDGKLFMVGRDAVVVYRANSGEHVNTLETERSSSHKTMGDRLVLSNGRGITQTVNMRSLAASPVVRHSTSNRYFGTLDQEAYVSQNGRYKLSINDDGYIVRYTF